MQITRTVNVRRDGEADRDRQIPPGPEDEYLTADDLFVWMGEQFDRFGDIFKALIYGTNVYVTRSPAFAYQVLVENWQNYPKGDLIKRVSLLLGNGLMASDGELWRRQRRMIQPSFHRKTIDIHSLTGIVEKVNAELLKNWLLAAQRGESVNVTRDVSAMALEVVLRSLLGSDYEEVGHHFQILVEQQARNLAFAQAFRTLGEIILSVVSRRKQESACCPDILGALMEARDPESGQPMRERQLVNEIFTLIVAGHETTASTLNWVWYLLSQHPDVEEGLSRELNELADTSRSDDLSRFPYTRQIIDETLRLYPAGWLITRKARNEDWLGDYFVPAGTEIYISPYFIQRHPGVWEDPDRFNPDRFRPENLKDRHRLATIPFSAGPRNCIGEFFARVEMQLHLMMIAKHLRLRYAQSRPLELDAEVNLRNKYDFFMYPEIKSGCENANAPNAANTASAANHAISASVRGEVHLQSCPHLSAGHRG